MATNGKCFMEKVFEKEFSDVVSKNAYLEACKWLAKNVYGKEGLNDYISVKIEKQKAKKNKKYVFKVVIYTIVDANELKEEFCKKCKMLHTTFYCVDKINCEECKMFAYHNNVENNLKGISKFVRETLEENELWEE